MSSKTHAPVTVSTPATAWVGAQPALQFVAAGGVDVFEDSDAFLLDARAFDFAVYVVEIHQLGVSGIDLVRLIRRHGASAIIAIDTSALSNFRVALDSGADMVLGADAAPGNIDSAIAAVMRRSSPSAIAGAGAWRLSRTAAQLTTPAGIRIALPDSDVKILACFIEAAGRPVDRRTLVAALWGKTASGMENALQATIYRLRKRIDAAGRDPSPIRSVAGTGYEFRASIDWE